MVGLWDSSLGAASVQVSAGDADACNDAYTIACLFQTDANAAHANRTAVGMLTSGATIRSLLNVDGALFCHNDFAAGFGVITRGNWYVGAVSKDVGNGEPNNFSLWQYNTADPMAHGTDGSTGNDAVDPITDLFIGSADGINSSGAIAVVAFWPEFLTLELNALVSTHFSAWKNLNPAVLLSFENWDGATGCVDVVDGATEIAVTGTVGVAADPPDWDWTLTPPPPSGNPGPLYFYERSKSSRRVRRQRRRSEIYGQA